MCSALKVNGKDRYDSPLPSKGLTEFSSPVVIHGVLQNKKHGKSSSF